MKNSTPEETRKKLGLVRLIGNIMAMLGAASAYGWLTGSDIQQAEAPSPWHWVWIVALVVIGAFLSWLGFEPSPSSEVLVDRWSTQGEGECNA